MNTFHRRLICLLAGLALATSPALSAEPASPTLTSEIASLSAQLTALDQKASESGTQAAKAKQEMDGASAALDAAERKVTAAQKELDTAQETATGLETKYKGDTESATAARAKATESTDPKAAAELGTRATALEKTAADDKTQLDAANAVVAGKKQALDAAKADLPAKQNAKKTAADKVQSTQSEAFAAATALQTTQAQIASKTEMQRNKVALDNGKIYSESLSALTMLFVIAVLLESAFATLFNWRLFRAYFSLRGVKTPVMIGVSWLVVSAFHLDVLANLIATYKSAGGGSLALPDSSLVSQLVTALILAGGSAGVNNIMVALGYRDNKQDESTARPPTNKAWISIHVQDRKTFGPVFVAVSESNPQPAEGAGPAPLAGTIRTSRAPLREIFLRNADRFPSNGGYELMAGRVYKIAVTAKDSNGAEYAGLGENYAFASGAIVDFDVALEKISSPGAK